MNMRLSVRALTLLLPLLAAASPAEPDLSGTYVLVQEATSVTKIPVLRDVVATVRTVGVLALSHREQRLEGSGQLCDLSIISSSKLVKTSFPPAFRRALPPLKIDASVERDAYGLRFRQGETLVVLGAHLKNERSDPLPEKASDPRVFDHDRDGFPGVTVSVDGLVSGQIYLVQRSSSRLEGRQVADGFRGRIHFQNEQTILGASKSLLDRDPGAVPDPARSRFRLQRVADDFDCRQALSASL